MQAVVLLVLVIIEIVLLVTGGFIFWALESPREKHQKEQQKAFNLTVLIDNFTDSHPTLSEDEVIKFVTQLLAAERSGLLSTRTSTDWDIHGSIFFCMTVVTTIGYGNLAPKTVGGQIFCCFYAIFGIPYTMVMLLGLGESLKTLSAKIQCRIMKNRAHINHIIRSLSFGIAGVVFFLLVPAAIFTQLEGWNYGPGVYYGVITMTSIGFGDYVAGVDCHGSACWLYRISVGIWIYLGLVWLAGLIGTIQDGIRSFVSKQNAHHFFSCCQGKKSPEEERKPTKNGTEGEENVGNDISIRLETADTGLSDSSSSHNSIEYASVRV